MAADVRVSARDGVGTVELRRPPHNFLDIMQLRGVTDALHELAADPDCRSAVVCAEGKNFCAGRDFSAPRGPGDDSASIYSEAARLMTAEIPWIAAVQGAAVGAGLGLALCADFRVAGPRASFAANFVAHGLHHGFGLTATLPRVVGLQTATELLYTGRRVRVEDAARIGLVNRVTGEDELRDAATAMAAELAASPPAAVAAIRATMRRGLVDDFRAATARESERQAALSARPETSRTPDDTRP